VPAWVPAVTANVATPLALVVEVLPAEKVARGSLAGPVKVTKTPDTGFPKLSLTIACRGVAKAVFTVADCPLPAVAMMVEAGPALLVKLKLAEALPTVAVTL
jgi:hypothetical protein